MNLADASYALAIDAAASDAAKSAVEHATAPGLDEAAGIGDVERARRPVDAEPIERDGATTVAHGYRAPTGHGETTVRTP